MEMGYIDTVYLWQDRIKIQYNLCGIPDKMHILNLTMKKHQAQIEE